MANQAANNTFVLPSSPSDLKKIRVMLEQGVACEARMDGEREAKKDVVEKIFEEFEVPKKISARMIKTMHKRNFGEVQAEMDDFQVAYEKITNA